MTMTVFDFENREVKIELPDKPIKAISVTVLSGDETGTVIFDDGTTVDFDASYWRICDFFDGSYILRQRGITPSVGTMALSFCRLTLWRRMTAFPSVVVS